MELKADMLTIYERSAHDTLTKTSCVRYLTALIKDKDFFFFNFLTLLRMEYNSRTKSHKNTKRKSMTDQISKTIRQKNE